MRTRKKKQRVMLWWSDVLYSECQYKVARLLHYISLHKFTKS